MKSLSSQVLSFFLFPFIPTQYHLKCTFLSVLPLSYPIFVFITISSHLYAYLCHFSYLHHIKTYPNYFSAVYFLSIFHTHTANLSPIMSEENTKEVSSKSAVAEDSSGNNKKLKTSGQMSEMLSIYQDYSEVRWLGINVLYVSVKIRF